MTAITYAIWDPGWYELDQPLKVGRRTELFFFSKIPEQFRQQANGRLVFFNTISEPIVYAEGTIVSIENAELGSVSEIDTVGLDYTFHLAGGEALVVNAEEDPGLIYDKVGDKWEKSARRVEDWTMVVGLKDLARPIPLPFDWKPKETRRCRQRKP